MDLFSKNNIKGKKIALYFTHKGEVDLEPLKKYFIQNGGRCFFPITLPDAIYMGEFDPAKEERLQCKTGAMGILEPDSGSCEELVKRGNGRFNDFKRMDWIFIPGIGYDLNGNRIGYGKGYYDRYISKYNPEQRPVLVAPAFEFQVTESIPGEKHDIPVNIIVTEKRIIHVS